MRALKLFFWLFPWLIIITIGWWAWYNWLDIDLFPEKELGEIQTHILVLEKMESLGKLELTKYQFQEITEIQQVGKEFYNLFKLENDSRAVLISRGEAVGCIDLTKMEVRHIQLTGDTLIVQLPPPELCYFKLNLDKTTVYALETGLFTSEKTLIEKAYKTAEQQIRQSALQSGILQQAKENAEMLLKPLLEEISGKHVILIYNLNTVKVRRER
jgi:hypothetical protein